MVYRLLNSVVAAQVCHPGFRYARGAGATVDARSDAAGLIKIIAGEPLLI